MLAMILDRARRRLMRDGLGEPIVAAEVGAADQTPADVVIAMVRRDLDRFAVALANSLDPAMPRPGSPALLAAALATAIERVGGQGRVTVTRSPAGLYTPEYWHVRVKGADAVTREALGRLTAGGNLS